MNKTVHFIVSGRVQGVFFRASTRQQAIQLGLTGWVKNLPDGRVEGQASGSAEAIEQFQSWLAKGPKMANVLKLETHDIAHQACDGFSIV